MGVFKMEKMVRDLDLELEKGIFIAEVIEFKETNGAAISLIETIVDLMLLENDDEDLVELSTKVAKILEKINNLEFLNLSTEENLEENKKKFLEIQTSITNSMELFTKVKEKYS